MKIKPNDSKEQPLKTKKSMMLKMGIPLNSSFNSIKNRVRKSSVDRGKIWIMFLIGLAFFSILAGLIVFFVYLIKLQSTYTVLSNNIDVEKTGQVGDFIGGVVGSIWSLTGVLLFYATLRLQSREFKENRIHFQLSRLTEIIYRQLEIFNTHLDNIQLKDTEQDVNGKHKEYKGRAAILLLTKRIEAIGNIQKKLEMDDDQQNEDKLMAEQFAFIEINITEFLNIYEELGNHIDTIRAVLIKEDIPPIDLNELKGIFFKNIGREFLNSSENLLPILNWYTEYKKRTDESYSEAGSIEKSIKRKINSIKKFRHTHYDKETIERYLARREMYNIHYF
jgi:hypothetical protein